MFIEHSVYARNREERKEKRVLTTGWARVCEFLKTEFDSRSESQIRARQAADRSCNSEG